MGYIQQYFGKEISQLTYGDVVSFFVKEKEESDKIEFKAYVVGGDEKEKENGVIKSVCGMLNSEGGLVIWGAPIGQSVTGKTEKIFKGNLSPVPRLIEKDYFINRISDGMAPTPRGVLFLTLQDNRNYIYLLESEPSDYKPHQFRNVYYMRIDAQTRPAPHPYIEALFRQVKYPILNGFVRFIKLTTDRTYFFLDIEAHIYNMSRFQNEHDVSFQLVVTKGGVFEESTATPPNPKYFQGGHEVRNHEAPLKTLFYDQPYRIHESIRLRPGDLAKVNNQLSIYFTIGGYSSPAILSKYTIKLNTTNLHADLESQIIEREENKYLHEISDALAQQDKEV
jgi:hypothetical protein